MNVIRGIGQRRLGAVIAGCVLGGAAAATIAAPVASAAPDCSPGGVSNTVNAVQASAMSYLGAHPGANQAVMAAYGQPRDVAAANLRGYFTANPGEYHELRAILAPIGETQRQCSVQPLPPALASAYDQFMAG